MPGVSNDQKKPSAEFLITVALVIVLFGYPLSTGPATWIEYKAGAPWLTKSVGFVYAPIHAGVKHGPDWLQNAYSDWQNWWRPRGLM